MQPWAPTPNHQKLNQNEQGEQAFPIHCVLSKCPYPTVNQWKNAQEGSKCPQYMTHSISPLTQLLKAKWKQVRGEQAFPTHCCSSSPHIQLSTQWKNAWEGSKHPQHITHSVSPLMQPLKAEWKRARGEQAFSTHCCSSSPHTQLSTQWKNTWEGSKCPQHIACSVSPQAQLWKAKWKRVREDQAFPTHHCSQSPHTQLSIQWKNMQEGSKHPQHITHSVSPWAQLWKAEWKCVRAKQAFPTHHTFSKLSSPRGRKL